jgi:hypothetical protein
MLAAHPESMVYRQAAPPLFVLSLLASLCTLPVSIVPVAAVAGPYALANLMVSVRTAVKHGLKYGMLLPLVFFTIHVAWGSGCLIGLKIFGIPRLDRIMCRTTLKKPTSLSIKTVQEANK